MIKQRRSNDCGIASLANLFGVTYKEANALVRAEQKARDEKFDGTDIDHARAAGLALGELVVPAIGHPKEFHALYWDGSRVHDPSGPGGYGAKGLKAFNKMRECWVLKSDGS